MIYFIQCETGEIKIGYTAGDPATRLAALAIGCPHKLTLLAAFEGGPEHEAALHRLFAADRIRGEWFRPSDALMAIIRQGFFRLEIEDKPKLTRRTTPPHCTYGRKLAGDIIALIAEYGRDGPARARAAAEEAVGASDERALELAFELLEEEVRAKFGGDGPGIMRQTYDLFAMVGGWPAASN